MRIKLSVLEYNSLIKYIDKLPLNIFSNKNENYIYIHGDKDDLELLLDILSDKFTKDGINDFGEINNIGLDIEKLIDLISKDMF
jgi:hypothetical protein